MPAVQLFVVGGAVRDRLLGQPAGDRDWVAVGATPEELLARGYRPVGKDFPVFLHPHTGEEVALARTERKSGRGYHGFTFHAAPDVTLEQDLARRDLTINAMAEAPDGTLIDPFGGERDLRAGVLRHVSPAFAEDPVRLLRLARFAARWPRFTVAPETEALLVRLVEAGEVDALVAERVWQELARGLMATRPSRMFEVLRRCGALARLLPEPRLDAAALAQLDRAAAAGAAPPVRFALLGWPDGATAARAAERLRAPAEVRELAELFAREHEAIAAWPAASSPPASRPLRGADEAQALLALFERCDALRRPQRFEALLAACELAADGAAAQAQAAKAARLRRLLHAVRATDTAEAADAAGRAGAHGPQVGEAVRRARLQALRSALDAAGSRSEA
ncbi:MAG: multifunctional CCA tRNA nucleotidyl transferase/2'3'-cyclic phosphodiesterase/2'nucleotidase/phosphatase [Rubrivivax sp.]|nr:multifunctional CCA tRNA nucleotidyl transferase/2'3'-cyclic phosphodiesterase/2'nucleotidase/phosphatase [Rubrivivax sp.]